MTEVVSSLMVGFMLRGLLYVLYARANDAKVVRSKDAQCKTRESP